MEGSADQTVIPANLRADVNVLKSLSVRRLLSDFTQLIEQPEGNNWLVGEICLMAGEVEINAGPVRWSVRDWVRLSRHAPGQVQQGADQKALEEVDG